MHTLVLASGNVYEEQFASRGQVRRGVLGRNQAVSGATTSCLVQIEQLFIFVVVLLFCNTQ